MSALDVIPTQATCGLRQSVADTAARYPGIPAVILRRLEATAELPASWCVQQVLQITSASGQPITTAVQLHTIETTPTTDKAAISTLKRLAAAEYGISAWAPAPGFTDALVPAALAAAMPR